MSNVARRLGYLLRATLAVVALAACSHASGAGSYRLVVRVDSDPGRPLPGATVSFLGKSVGQTDAGGAVGLAITGTEGENIALTVSCPDGFRSPDKPVNVVLHHLAEAGRKPEYDFQCPPLNRTVVVVVRADHGPNLPVLHLGKEIARTDESGAAHALVSVPANDDVEITLSTNDPGSERLRPQNPTMKFMSSDGDELKLFNIKFALDPEKRRTSASGPRLPVRLH